MNDFDKYSRFKQVIDEAISMDIVDFGEGVPQSWIDDAEYRLGFSLPSSYKWWLLHYGGGEIYGDEVYSLYGPDVNKGEYSGDIVYQYELKNKSNQLLDNQLVVCNIDGSDYYFDLTNKVQHFEYPIYSSLDPSSKYADNFLEFLEKQIHTDEL